jgi:putative serine protease PepD
VPVLASGKDFEHAWLGTAGPAAGASGVAPAVINGVTAGGPAGDAGLRVGDTITSVNGKEITQFSDVVKQIDSARPGDKVDIKVRRGGDERTVAVTLGTRPNTQP